MTKTQVKISKDQELNILIVDDDLITRKTLQKILESSGCSVTAAASGEEAIKLFSANMPDMVLLDVMMPGMDGYETSIELRKICPIKHLPIIMLTGLNDVESVEKAFQAGATDFITKPINWPLLIQRVKYALRSYELHNELIQQQQKIQQAQQIARLTYIELDKTLEHVSFSKELNSLFDLELPTTGCLLSEYYDHIHQDDQESFIDAIHHTFHLEQDHDTEYRLLSKNGEYLTVRQNSTPRYQNNQLTGVIATLQDITAQERVQSLMEYRTYFDNVTDLPNLKSLQEDLHKIISDNSEDSLTALFSIKLDRFKTINETLGYDVGNRLLKLLAENFSSYTHDMVKLYRTSGGSFGVIASQQHNMDEITELANIILKETSKTISIDKHELNLSASIGIVLHPLENSDDDSLIKFAESAASLAKQQGGNGYQFYSAEMQTQAHRKLSMEAELRKAVEQEQFVLYYQPQVNTHTHEIIGMEALIRWQHPEKGMIPPFHFIPIAEETGLIKPIGEWVLEEACRKTLAWHQQGHEHLRIGINLSARQLENDDIIRVTKNTLARTGINPKMVELEVTESAAMTDFKQTLALLHELRDLGITLSIDDFGTGHSSLSYLQQLPVHTLKIDRAFIKDIGTEKDDGTIAKTIVAMAHSLKLNVIAEGIETVEHLQFLQQCGCDEIQGYLFSQPLPEDEFTHYLAKPGSIELPQNIKTAS